MVVGAFPDLCVDDVAAAVSFYGALLDLEVMVDEGWYAELGADGRVLLALVADGHETVPGPVAGPARGLLVSFEVDDAPKHVAMAGEMGCPFLVELVTELGQCHFMVADPSGTVVDVIQRVPLTRDDTTRRARYRREHRRA